MKHNSAVVYRAWAGRFTARLIALARQYLEAAEVPRGWIRHQVSTLAWVDGEMGAWSMRRHRGGVGTLGGVVDPADSFDERGR